MSAALTSEWTTPGATSEPETYATHAPSCPVCRVFADECVTGRALRAAAEAMVEHARARASRDARILRGEHVNEPDPAYLGRRVLRIQRRP